MTYWQPLYPLMLALLGFALWRSSSRQWRRVAGGAAVGLLLLSWPPVAALSMASLESPYLPQQAYPAGEADAIVVLSDNLLNPEIGLPEPSAAEGTYRRCRRAAWLYHHWRALPVIATGGIVNYAGTAAVTMRHVLEAEGVPAAMIRTEEHSRSTYENALYSAQILRSMGARRVVVVTEAFHMRRAVACFRKQGFTVLPAPCGFRSTLFEFAIKTVLPAAAPIAQNGDALHEWAGMAWYKLRGRI